MSKYYHPYHLVDPSPWPYFGGTSALLLTVGSVLYFHYSQIWLLNLGLLGLLMTMVVWWSDVMSEASYLGLHTSMVQSGLKYGMLLFIVSEVCFFFSFFWAFFHSSLSPTVELGAVWPPTGMFVLNPFAVPLLNTAMLLSSGATVTWAHHAIMSGQSKESVMGLSMTVALGIMFTALQAMEYFEAPFSMADSMYGSTFFMATGFHGFHVIMGTSFLAVCLWSLINHQFTSFHHLGFEAASWYWHFVDVVWLFLYVCMYWWGS